jgi:hypothetical protein
MKLDWLSDDELEDWIRASLRAIREAASKGLEREEAIRRARETYQLILADRIPPEDFELDQQRKDVLYAMVYVVLDAEISAGGRPMRQAMAVYEFIRGIQWDDDDLGERETLLTDCVAAARRHLGAARAEGAGQKIEPAVASEGPNVSPEEAIKRIFGGTVPALHAIFTDVHGLSEAEAERLEGELYEWFIRFCRREANLQQNARALLLAAGSQFALQYRRFQDEAAGASTPLSARLARLLGRVLTEAARDRPSPDN